MPVSGDRRRSEATRGEREPTARSATDGAVESTNAAPRWSGCARKGSTPTRPSRCGPSARGSRTCSPRTTRRPLEPGEHPELRYQIAGRLISRRGTRQDGVPRRARPVRLDPGGRARGRARPGDLRPHPQPRHRRHRRDPRLRLRHPARPAGARGDRVHAADQDAAPAAGQAPRARRHGHPLPLPRARPDRQRRDARAVHHALQDRLRDPRMAQRTQLRRGRNAGPAVARRRRRVAAVHDPPQRARPRPVPAHLGRAVPQPLHRRRYGERLRHGQGVPQRGHLPQAQPRVHDHRVHDAPTPTTTTWRR